MSDSDQARRQDAIEIWKAGVDAVDSIRLVKNALRVDGDSIDFGNLKWNATPTSKICVVGAGKAGAGMAAGVEEVLGQRFASQLSGWVNVPEDCVKSLEHIYLHGARPAGLNEPTEAGVSGTMEILKRVESLGTEDLCLVLISGGGSALLPAPIEGISLEDKQTVTRLLMKSGATIQELNTVRRALSRVKGGGLLRACGARVLVALIISDVIGDPLETIASGPTVDVENDPTAAIDTLNRFSIERFPASVVETLECLTNTPRSETHSIRAQFSNLVIGNNLTAVDAAARKATELGYQVVLKETDQSGDAADWGRDFGKRCVDYRKQLSDQPVCLISGGEPTVQLAVTDQPQKGGRNQELVLAGAEVLTNLGAEGITILSGGTDGEDGPTDSAGAVIDAELLNIAESQQVQISDYLSVNNSYSYFQAIGGLLKTGPTHTNVMDLRVGLLRRIP